MKTRITDSDTDVMMLAGDRPDSQKSIKATANMAAVKIQEKLRGLHCGTENSTINIDGDDFQKMFADIIIEAIG